MPDPCNSSTPAAAAVVSACLWQKYTDHIDGKEDFIMKDIKGRESPYCLLLAIGYWPNETVTIAVKFDSCTGRQSVDRSLAYSPELLVFFCRLITSSIITKGTELFLARKGRLLVLKFACLHVARDAAA